MWTALKISSALLVITGCCGLVSSQSGGTFTITQSVIAGGGGQSTGGAFTATGTAGQGTTDSSTGGAFTLKSGFWNAAALAPTAAHVGIGGRVMTPDGAGLRNAIVRVMDQSGKSRMVRTNGFGYYRFEEVQVGQSYLITVDSRKFVFAPRAVMLIDELTDADFTPQP